MKKLTYLLAIMVFILALGWVSTLQSLKQLETSYNEAKIEAVAKVQGYETALEGKEGELQKTSEDMVFITGLADRLEKLFQRTSNLLAKLDKVVKEECYLSDASAFPYIYGKIESEWVVIAEDYAALGQLVDAWVARQPKSILKPAT